MSGCRHCSAATALFKNGKPKKFCGQACLVRWHRAQPRVHGKRYDECMRCGSAIPDSAGPCARVCSHACRRKSGRPRKPRSVYRCAHCSTSIESLSRRRFCCPACMAAATSVGARPCRSKQVREQRIRSRPFEHFTRLEIMQRDNWTCRSCGQRTRPDLSPNHALYPNLDHIVPIARGGHHVRANVRCLCRACNIAKADLIVTEAAHG